MVKPIAGQLLQTADVKQESLSRIQEMNRKLILDAALEVFSTYGYRGATIDQIAQKSGMSKPNLLYYFRRKQDIYVTVLEDTLAVWLQPLQDLDPAGEPIEELARYIRIKMTMSFTHPEASRLFANEILHGAPAIAPFLHGQLRRLVDEKAGVITQWITQKRLRPVNPHHLIFSIWATTQHYADFEHQVSAVMGERTAEPTYREEAIAAVTDILLNGICPH